MNYNEILELVRAGYTRDEINAMQDPAPAPQSEPPADPQPAEPPAADPQPEPAAAPPATETKKLLRELFSAAEPPATETEKLLRELLGGMSTLTKAVQAGNRANITREEPPDRQQAAGAATARIINPHYGERKE